MFPPSDSMDPPATGQVAGLPSAFSHAARPVPSNSGMRVTGVTTTWSRLPPLAPVVVARILTCPAGSVVVSDAVRQVLHAPVGGNESAGPAVVPLTAMASGRST